MTNRFLDTTLVTPTAAHELTCSMTMRSLDNTLIPSHAARAMFSRNALVTKDAAHELTLWDSLID